MVKLIHNCDHCVQQDICIFYLHGTSKFSEQRTQAIAANKGGYPRVLAFARNSHFRRNFCTFETTNDYERNKLYGTVEE